MAVNNNKATPSRGARYVVAFHQADNIKTVGFSKEETARLLYNSASNEWARIFVDSRYSPVGFSRYVLALIKFYPESVTLSWG